MSNRLVWLVSRLAPSVFHMCNRLQSRKLKREEPSFVLTLDCDTPEDIDVVLDVDRRLSGLGIKPIYAVPGELLLRGKDVYGQLIEEGREFLNHGFYQHCSFDRAQGKYISSFFYDQTSPQLVEEDILLGHSILEKSIGATPKGFRAPHFGSFNKARDLYFLYSILKRLNYKYASTTTPVYSYKRGDLFFDFEFGVCEIPVSGCYDYPLATLDSWGFRYDPTRRVNEQDFILQFQKIASEKIKSSGLINIYADPSQIHDWPEFFSVVESVAHHNVGSFEDLIKKIGGQI